MPLGDRLLHLLFHPGAFARIASAVPGSGLDVSHRCGRGNKNYGAGDGEWVCVNGYHTVLATHDVNVSHNYCRRAVAQLCTHIPKCVWTNLVGKWLPCRNTVPLKAPCDCGMDCFNPDNCV